MKKVFVLSGLLLCFSYSAFSQCSNPDAGLNNAVCGPSYNLHVTNATTGYWTACNGLTPLNPQPSFSPSNTSENPVVTLSNLQGNKIIRFVWTDYSGPCTDTVQIEFVQIPVVSAGPDKDVCGSDAVMEGVSSGFGGTWLPNGASFDNFADPETGVYSNIYGAKPFTWLETHLATTVSLACSSQDEVVITFWRKPTANILTDVLDSLICGLTFNELYSENPGSGISGFWWSDEPANFFDPNSEDGKMSVSFYNYGINNVYWIESTGPALWPEFCMDTAGPLRLYFIEQPLVSAGFDDYLYGYTYELNGEIMFEENPDFEIPYNTIWQTDDALIANPAELTTNATVVEFGEYEFRFLAYYTDFSSCFYKDTVRITYVDPIFIGIETDNLDETNFNIYPNPVNSQFSFSNSTSVEKISITDVNGRLVEIKNHNLNSIDVSDLESGVYFVEINTNDGVVVKRFVKE